VIRRAFTPYLLLVTLTLIPTVFGARQAKAQSSTPSGDPQAVQASPDSASTTAQVQDDAGALDLAEPDFTVVNIPTTLRLPVHKGNFHLTHRFNGNLRNGSFTDQLSNLFGIDQGATVGFEYRFGVMRNLQAAAYRSSFDRTIQLYGKYDALHQSAPGAQGGSVLSKLVSISGLVSIEGSDNFQERFAPALGAVFSREIKDRLAVYAAPIWVHCGCARHRQGHFLRRACRSRSHPADDLSHRRVLTTGVGLRSRAVRIRLRRRSASRSTRLPVDVHEHVWHDVRANRSGRQSRCALYGLQSHAQVLLTTRSRIHETFCCLCYCDARAGWRGVR
jgi:Membrane bound beta barrel domain (DUF5777)